MPGAWTVPRRVRRGTTNSAHIAGFRGETVEVTAAGVQVLPGDTLEDDMTVPDRTGQPDIERPIDLTDTPDKDNPGPAPTPEHHPDDAGLAGEDLGTPGITPVE